MHDGGEIVGARGGGGVLTVELGDVLPYIIPLYVNVNIPVESVARN